MMLISGWEQSGTVQRGCEGNSWAMALSGPGTRPAWVEVRVAEQASLPGREFHAKLVRAGLSCY